MTMFSADDDTRRFCGGAGYGAGAGAAYLGSDLLFGMADHHDLRNELVEEQESTSKDARERDQDQDQDQDQEWLQLSIGGHLNDQPAAASKNNSSPLVELDLMPTAAHSQIRQEFRPPCPPLPNFGGFPPSFFLQNHADQINWAFRPFPITIAPSSSSSYFPRPFQLDMASPPPTPDFRVIQPPRRPHSGVWFMLQASLNQEKQPFLPQISKSYLRIKDGRMTVRLVIKYLVNKLSLEDESEIEIRCKGQRLLPFLTLQHVRDNIWSSSRDFITLLPNSSTTHHIMVLHYARTDPSN